LRLADAAILVEFAIDGVKRSAAVGNMGSEDWFVFLSFNSFMVGKIAVLGGGCFELIFVFFVFPPSPHFGESTSEWRFGCC